ncbi:hypothetical protein FTUN_4430 [Frigoriglobus tundricola]|uniref:Uncharacterized protein n=1 Tax=Frigoriglobus tundricola TaxID=2774151 RepID=A0A6M5YU35_9BACT|nr:hypothetical protein FTUN_4430 [Frigoriglobus tundricola]
MCRRAAPLQDVPAPRASRTAGKIKSAMVAITPGRSIRDNIR